MIILNKDFGNQFNLSKLTDILSTLESKEGVEISFPGDDEVNDFYKIIVKDKHKKNCPFSIWIEDKAGTKIFFNIGLPTYDATVYHNFDISTEKGVDDIIEFIQIFSSSKIVKTSIFCRNKLKRINYKVLNQKNIPEFSCLYESFFFCINKRREIKTYSSWLE